MKRIEDYAITLLVLSVFAFVILLFVKGVPVDSVKESKKNAETLFSTPAVKLETDPTKSSSIKFPLRTDMEYTLPANVYDLVKGRAFALFCLTGKDECEFYSLKESKEGYIIADGEFKGTTLPKEVNSSNLKIVHFSEPKGKISYTFRSQKEMDSLFSKINDSNYWVTK